MPEQSLIRMEMSTNFVLLFGQTQNKQSQNSDTNNNNNRPIIGNDLQNDLLVFTTG